MLPPILGTSPTIRALRKLIPDLADGDEPLLIVGESGVGKTLFAEHIHAKSKFRKQEPRMLDCSLLSTRDQRLGLLGAEPPELSTTHRGIFEIATTVIIKNVDLANGFLQERVVEALRSQHTQRLGSRRVFPVLSRSLFTLHSSPETSLASDRLKNPLHSIFRGMRTVIIPPLKERKKDLRLLVDRFMPAGASRSETRARLVKLVQSEVWKENVRELKAYLRTLVVVAHEESLRQHERIELEKMIMMIEQGRDFSLRQSLSLIESGIVDRALSKTGGNQASAARLLGITDRTIRRIAANSGVL